MPPRDSMVVKQSDQVGIGDGKGQRILSQHPPGITDPQSAEIHVGVTLAGIAAEAESLPMAEIVQDALVDGHDGFQASRVL